MTIGRVSRNFLLHDFPALRCCATFALAAACAAAPRLQAQDAKTNLAAAESGAAVTSSVAAAHTDPMVVAPTGLNFSVDMESQHNSATGWDTILTPDVSWRFNRHVFADANVPLYLSVNAYVPTTVKGVTTDSLLSKHGALGDAATAVHYEANGEALSYLGSATVGYPTGNTRFGLSANTVTYNFTNHGDYSIGDFDFDLEAGFGNSSALANPAIRKAYTATGPLANFQAGGSVELPLNLNLDLEAYEDLPIGNQKIYGTVTHKNKKGKTVTTQVLQGNGVAEDNGFLAELDLPLGRHFVLAGTYDRSLIQGLDTAGVGLTWTLRSPKILMPH